jgi:hypothetical protein
MKAPIMQKVHAVLIFAGLIIAPIAVASLARADGPCTNYRGSSKACYCPSGQRPAVFSLVCSYYVDNSGNQCSAETCMGACNCQNIPQAQTSRQEPPVQRAMREDGPLTQTPELAPAPSDDAEGYWRVPDSCLPAWNYFRERAAHGAFAVTKTAGDGGCGWSWSPTRPIETMRRQALATCAKYGPECRIIREK